MPLLPLPSSHPSLPRDISSLSATQVIDVIQFIILFLMALLGLNTLVEKYLKWAITLSDCQSGEEDEPEEKLLGGKSDKEKMKDEVREKQ